MNEFQQIDQEKTFTRKLIGSYGTPVNIFINS